MEDRENWTHPLGVGYTSGKKSTMLESCMFSPEFNARVVLELISDKIDLTETSRESGTQETLFLRWKQELIERATQLFEQQKLNG